MFTTRNSDGGEDVYKCQQNVKLEPGLKRGGCIFGGPTYIHTHTHTQQKHTHTHTNRLYVYKIYICVCVCVCVCVIYIHT